MLYVKTDAGRNEVVQRSLSLTPAQRQALILCDGKRHLEDLEEMMPIGLEGALNHLLKIGLLVLADATIKEKPVEIPLSEVERFRSAVELATSMAVDLGFTARVRAQLQIERAHSVRELTKVVDLFNKYLPNTPLKSLRLNKLRQLAHVD